MMPTMKHKTIKIWRRRKRNPHTLIRAMNLKVKKRKTPTLDSKSKREPNLDIVRVKRATGWVEDFKLRKKYSKTYLSIRKRE